MKFLYCFVFLCAACILTSCSLLNTPENKVDYSILEKTASMHITQTYEAMPTATSTFTPIPTNTPEPTATEVPTATEIPEEFLIVRVEEEPTEIPPTPTATIVFPDKADAVAALPSPNQFLPNQHFNLTWQIKNTGTSTWSGKYKFYYSDGIQLMDQTSYSITETIAPGEILTITMPASAPNNEGTYKTTWVLENPDGIPFYWINYVTIVGDKTFITQAPELNPTATPSSLEWMCSDPERSLIQGEGCSSFCSEIIVTEMNNNGMNCYAFGESVAYGN